MVALTLFIQVMIRFLLYLVFLFAVNTNASNASTNTLTPDLPSSSILPLSSLKNPVYETQSSLRDPSVYKDKNGYHLYYSRFDQSRGNWGNDSAWSVREVLTPDFVHYENDHAISPDGYASPGDVVFWGGRYVIPYQKYPGTPKELCFSESKDLKSWTSPKSFLGEALSLPWNVMKRAIDPSFVIDGNTLHCFFIGSRIVPTLDGHGTMHANLLGHAITTDPELKQWKILTTDKPLIGTSDSAPDGVENIMVFKTGKEWTMIYSEGLTHQHLARATSPDLVNWKLQGPIQLSPQSWMKSRYGAPYVFSDGNGGWVMILMGEAARKQVENAKGEVAGKTTLGLLTSPEGKTWTLLPEKH